MQITSNKRSLPHFEDVIRMCWSQSRHEKMASSLTAFSHAWILNTLEIEDHKVKKSINVVHYMIFFFAADSRFFLV